MLSSLATLWSAYSAFSWGKFSLFDYGVNINTGWNLAHGNGFKVLENSSYLQTHLSFSLLLPALFFHFSEHPFILSAFQWLCSVAGAVLFFVAGKSLKLATLPVLAVIFYFVCFPFTQQVLLSEYHGVSLYFLLVPGLYLGLIRGKAWAWLPLVLILGTREDAFVFLLPLLLYFFLRHRSRMALAMLIVSLLYGFFALFVLYPHINGVSLMQRRSNELSAANILQLDGDSLSRRLRALGWTYIPVLPFFFFGRRIIPLLAIPSLALLSALLSGFARQQGLTIHYPAAVTVCMTVALFETLRSLPDLHITKRMSWVSFMRMSILLLLVVIFHLRGGFFWGGAFNRYPYKNPGPISKAVLAALANTPPQGLLLTNQHLAAFAAAREDLTVWSRWEKEGLEPMLILESMDHNTLERLAPFLPELRQGSWGVLHYDGTYFVLGKGASTERNATFLESLRYLHTEFRLARSRTHHGETVWDPRFGLCRYWSGNGSRGLANLAYGLQIELPAGEHEILLEYHVRAPLKTVKGTWGRLEILDADSRSLLLQQEIPHIASPVDELSTMRVSFSLKKASKVEAILTGSDAELWLTRIAFLPSS